MSVDTATVAKIAALARIAVEDEAECLPMVVPGGASREMVG